MPYPAQHWMGSTSACSAHCASSLRIRSALNNNLVTLVKGTTVAYAIGVPELMTASSTIWGASVNIPEMMIVLLVTFLAIVAGLVFVLHRVEQALRIPGYTR